MAHELTISVGLIIVGVVGIVLVFGACAVLLRDAFGGSVRADGDRRTAARRRAGHVAGRHTRG
jgi:ribose/xylose/arabinose/galactoside ABC-type transport system permease subunit